MSDELKNKTIEITTQSAEKVIKNKTSVLETETHDISAKDFETESIDDSAIKDHPNESTKIVQTNDFSAKDFETVSEPESINDIEFQIEKNIKNENSTIEFEILSDDHHTTVKDGPNDTFKSTKIVQQVNTGRIENISIITPSADETRNNAINKVDNNYVTILIIAGIAIVFLILIGILFCTFFVSGKKV